MRFPVRQAAGHCAADRGNGLFDIVVAFVDAWRRLGPAGLAGRTWERSIGRVVDVRFVIEWALDAPEARFAPLPGYRYERGEVAERSETAGAAAQLLGVRLDERLGSDLFVARDGRGRVAACTWNDPPRDGAVRHRGVGVDPEHRGRSLGGSLLLFQARELCGSGVGTILYRTSVGNRASRRMFHRIGARWNGMSALLVVLGRRAAVTTLSGRAEEFFRRRFERESRDVLGG